MYILIIQKQSPEFLALKVILITNAFATRNVLINWWILFRIDVCSIYLWICSVTMRHCSKKNMWAFTKLPSLLLNNWNQTKICSKSISVINFKQIQRWLNVFMLKPNFSSAKYSFYLFMFKKTFMITISIYAIID